MSNFFVRISEMNRTFFLKSSSVPKFDAERVKTFSKILADETTEFNDLLEEHQKAIDAEDPDADINALTAYLDCLADHIVYCASEAGRLGINMNEILDRVMHSQDTKLVDGSPIFSPDGGKFIKGPAYEAPENAIKTYIKELIAERSARSLDFNFDVRGHRLVWPKGVSESMDKHAAYHNLEHWSCTSRLGNDCWERIDGVRHTATFKDQRLGYVIELQQIDLDNPLPTELYLSQYFPTFANSGHGKVFPRPDGLVYRCSGPTLCHKCIKDNLLLNKIKTQDDGIVLPEQPC